MSEQNTESTSIQKEHLRTSTNYDQNALASRYANASYLSYTYRQVMDIYNIKQLICSVCPSSQPMEKLLDVGCGDGVITRQFVQDNIAQFVVGLDLSKAMIHLATEENKQDNKRYKYLVHDIRNIVPNEIGGIFPLVISVYVLQNAETVDDLYCMLSEIRRVCSKSFVGIIPNPFFPVDQAYKFRKYGLNVLFPHQPKDNDSFPVIFDFDKPSSFTVTNFWYSHETYESMFRKAGFRTFEWVNMEVDPQTTEEQRIFFADLTERGMGFVASV